MLKDMRRRQVVKRKERETKENEKNKAKQKLK